jgi:hypothetical protein
MPTRYFKDSVDQNWETLGNWWADAAFTEGFSGTLTGVTVTDTDTEVTCDSTAGLVVGRPITGDGIDTGTTVASITDGTTFELSQAAISTETSDLTCELHVVPVTGDDAVVTQLSTWPYKVVGTPSADVLGTVTVNGSSKLEVTLAASSFVFNDTSMIEYWAVLTGDATFNDNSFKATSVSFTGNCTFNDNSYNWGPLTGNCTFNDSSYNADGGSITGNATFTNTAFSTATTGFFNPQMGTVSGTVDFPNGATFTLANSEVWNVDASYWTGTLAWVFNGSSYNSGTIYGNCTFNDTSYNSYAISATTVTFNDSTYNRCPTDYRINATTIEFNDYSTNGLWGGSAGYITGDCVFNNSSFNEYNGHITGNASFTEAEYSAALQGGSTSGTGPQQGTVTGTVTFTSLTPVKFTLAWNEGWYVDTTGWVFDTAGQNWVFNDTSFNSGGITGDCTLNDSSYNAGNVTGTVTFNDTSFNGVSGYANIYGSCTFNDYSYTGANGTITGSCTFNDSSYCYNGSTIYGDPIFNDSSYNYGTITGNASFNGSSYNGGIITGNGIIRQHAAAFVAWRDYATSTYITGTLTLQFPEMDILGTGLL